MGCAATAPIPAETVGHLEATTRPQTQLESDVEPPTNVSDSSAKEPITTASPDQNVQCKSASLIDDAEDGDAQILQREGRAGFWYTAIDRQGSSIWPGSTAHEHQFEMSRGGSGRSRWGVRITGRLASSDDPGTWVGAIVGFNLPKERGPYDATSYDGVSFWARADAGDIRLRVKIPDGNSAPDHGVCTECYNDFGHTVTVTSEFREYHLRFSDLRQEVGWGDPRPPRVDPSSIYGILFATVGQGRPFDVTLDDVAFLTCESSLDAQR
jgi:endoglucanase